MKFSISVPFGTFRFYNASQHHYRYFKTQFIDLVYHTPKKISIAVTFKKPVTKNLSSLENTFFSDTKTFYIADIKGKLCSFDFASLTRKSVAMVVDPEFDLYYLYSFIIEPTYITKAAANGVLCLHASAVAKNNQATVFTAWRHTGKTDSVLHLANQGYQFLGDDYCVIYRNRAYLYPKKLNIFSYNLLKFPRLFTKLPAATQLRLRFTLVCKQTLQAIAEHTSGSLNKVFYRLAQLAEISTNIKVDPQQAGIVTVQQATLKTIISLEKTVLPNPKPLIKISAPTLRQKTATVLRYELTDFFNYYQAFRYFFPTKKSLVVDNYLTNVVQLVQDYASTAYSYRLADHTVVDTKKIESV